MSTTEEMTATLNGIPLATVMNFLSERGQVELELAVSKAQVAILSQTVETLSHSLEESNGVRNGNGGAEGEHAAEQAGSSGSPALRPVADD